MPVQRAADADGVDRLHQVEEGYGALCLVGLQVTDQVPARDARDGALFSLRLLDPILADLVVAGGDYRLHLGGRPGLRDGDNRYVSRIAPSSCGGQGDPVSDDFAVFADVDHTKSQNL